MSIVKLNRIIVIISLSLFFVNSTSAVNKKELETIQNNFKANTRKILLSNGIRVILYQNKLSPTIACYLKIGVGSANEPFDQAGTAHFLEHLLFKGTSTIGTQDFTKEEPVLLEIEKTGNQIDLLKLKIEDPLLDSNVKIQYEKEIKELSEKLKLLQQDAGKFVISEEDSTIYSLAGQIGYNAYTSPDVTNYQIKLPKNRLELWAYMESDRFKVPVFREYYAERDVIQEERKMRFDSNPGSLLYELFNSTAFGFSPYGKPVIGYANNIPSLTMQNTRDFYNSQYIPSRMVIAISGDIDFEETIKILKKYFETLPYKEDPSFPPIQYEKGIGRKTAELIAEYSPSMITGWVKPSLLHKDNTAYEVLSRILTDGQNSRLVKKLVIDDKLAQSVKSYNGIPAEKLENGFAIFVNPYDEKEYSHIYSIIQSELNEIEKNGVSEDEMVKVKNRIFKEVIDSLNSNTGMAELLSYYELMMHDYNYLFTYLDEINKITSEDMKRIVKTTFVEKNNTTVWIKKPD